MWNILKLFSVVVILHCCEAANILYVIPYAVKSHYIMQRPVGLELARRGHNVTVITAHREKDPPPTYHQVMVNDILLWDVLGGKRPNLFTMTEYSARDFFTKVLWKGGYALTESALKSPEVQVLLSGNQKFDLVISELFFQEATNMLAHKYQAPLVLISTLSNTEIQKLITGNPLELATVPHEYLIARNPTTILGRLKNFCFTAYEYLWWRYWFLRDQEVLALKYIPDLPKPVPSLYEVQQNVSLVLMNSHFSFQSPASLLPNMVEIGGLHLIESDTKLPDDLQKVLDNSPHGVVYVNFGSNVRSSELSIEKKNAFINVFKKLNYTVLWKWEDENLENKPSNVVIRKWLPQKEILSHPNIKVFLSHGGLIGTLEAVFHGVPIIGVPVYGDQYRNLHKIEEAGTGVLFPYNDINEENLERVLLEFLKDDSYLIRARELARRFRDRPMHPLDTAMFWIEYVIRNKGANFMKSPAIKLNWLTYNMFDIYAFILIVLLTILYVIQRIWRIIRNVQMRVNITICNGKNGKLKNKSL